MAHKHRKAPKSKSKKEFKLPNIPLWIVLLAVWLIMFAAFLFSGKMLFGTDMLQDGHYARLFYTQALKQGIFPLWDPHIHGGMPFIEAIHGDVFYPTVLLKLLLPLEYAISFGMVLHLFLAGLFMYLFLRRFQLGKGASFLGGLSYMLAPFIVSLLYAGQDGKIYASSLLPLAFYTLLVAMERRRLFDYLVFGLVYLLMVLTPHMQIAYFTSWALGAFFLFYQIRRFLRGESEAGAGSKRLWSVGKQTGAFLLGVGLLLGVGAVQIIPSTHYLSHYSQRLQHKESGYDYSTSWSLHPEELVSALVLPEFAGHSVGQDTYWGRNPFKLNSDYVGIVVFLMAVFALIFSKRAEKWLFGGIALFAMIYALGATTPFFKLFYYLIPQVKKFRAPSLIWLLAGFSLIVLASIAIDIVADTEKRSKINAKGLRFFFGIVGLWLLAMPLKMAILGKTVMSIWRGVFYSGIDSAHYQKALSLLPHITSGAWIVFGLGIVALGVLYLIAKGKLPTTIGVGIIALVIIVDLWRVDKPFVQVVDPKKYYGKTQIVDFLKKRVAVEGPFRVFIMPKTLTLDNNYLANFGIDEVTFTALHGNQLLWYDKFVGRLSNPPNLYYTPFWDALNVRYVLSRQRLPEQWLEHLHQLGNIGGITVYENPHSLPRAAFFTRWRVLSDEEQILTALKSGNVAPQHDLLLAEAPSGITPYTGTDSLPSFFPVEIDGWDKINHYTIEFDAPVDGILFVGDNYYPDWRAFENGKEIPVMRADYSFRGVPLPAGHHKIEFRYDSPILKKSLVMGGVSLLLAIALGAVSLIVTRQR